MAEVRFHRVSKHFGAVRAVRDLDLTIRDEEFLVFVGPSGCGKSTVLRMLAGLESVTAGEIRIGDRRVNDVPPKDRDIAMVFQSYALYPHMSVYDNMAFGLKLRKVPHAEIDERVRQAAAILGLEELLGRKPKQLSGGQRQRVAVGRAIVRQPAVFLMDEPLSNLDAKLRVAARAEIMALHRRLRTTFVYVTHDQVEAMTMGDRIAILRDGVLQQVDAPSKVYRDPANVFVGGFIGSPSMNFFPAELAAADGRTELDARDFRVPAPAWLVSSHGERAVTVGVRPEHIHAPAYVPPDPALVPLRGIVEVVELLGYEAHLHVRTRHGRLVANVDGRVGASEGDELELLVDARELHLFDADSQEALRPPQGA